MLRSVTGQKRLQLRCLQDALARQHSPVASSSKTKLSACLTRCSLDRGFGTTSTDAAKAAATSSTTRNEASHQSHSKSIYPDSRASERRHPHAPQLFQHFRRHDVGQDASNAKDANHRSSSDTYILRNVSTDPELKQLYTALGRAADEHDPVQATRLCQLIKERKQHLSGTPGKITFEPQEKVVFLAMMRAVAHYGLLEDVQAINADMLSFGSEECIDSLNHLLQAAVVCADEEATSAILERIFALQPSSSSATERSDELAKLLLNERQNAASSSKSRRAVTLPIERVRNWNAATFAHVMDSACQDHNLEFALLLLSTCYRVDLTLPHDTLTRLVGLCLHAEEFRTAVELADLIEEGGLVYREHAKEEADFALPSPRRSVQSEARSGQVARRLAPSIWMSILRACADGGYLPGVELAWSRAVTQGLQSPDEGTMHLILALAAKEGGISMARICLRHIDPTFDPQPSPGASGATKRPPLSTPAKRLELQGWHLAALFEAYCTMRDYDGAMRTLLAFHQRGIRITERNVSRISTSVYPDKHALQLAIDALTRAATDSACGTHIVIVNAVLSAAVWLGELEKALDIYRSIPTFHPLATPLKLQTPEQPKKLRANLDTFHALLSGCIDAADYETGVQLLKEVNEMKMKPTVVTFERMIILCLTQSKYDDAFGFIEEAKDRDITPSRKSYETLIRKCWDEGDHRWQQVLADMKSQGFHPSPKLIRELDLDPAMARLNPPRNRA